jgi:hypothetical protein
MNPNHKGVLAAAMILFLLGAVSATRADTYTVTNTNGSGPGSLAHAILESRMPWPILRWNCEMPMPRCSEAITTGRPLKSAA